MGEGEREQLRRLAVWLACRRDVDAAVEHLTRYGPAASDQVASHLAALTRLLELEADAFAAVEAGAPRVAQLPLPTSEPLRASVHSLQQARGRRKQA
ncbi:MAG: hypothetical protein JWN08_3288 [Frankiales bacterium]|nr:hypothetical protein [Frankiales bacterium]